MPYPGFSEFSRRPSFFARKFFISYFIVPVVPVQEDERRRRKILSIARNGFVMGIISDLTIFQAPVALRKIVFDDCLLVLTIVWSCGDCQLQFYDIRSYLVKNPFTNVWAKYNLVQALITSFHGTIQSHIISINIFYNAESTYCCQKVISVNRRRGSPLVH